MKHRFVNIYEYTGKAIKENSVPVSEKRCAGIGLFHAWGCEYEQFETGAGNYSTAIIELPDGKMKNIPIEMIEFVEPLIEAEDKGDRVVYSIKKEKP